MNTFDNDGDQLLVSPHLLLFLSWLLDQEQETLRRLVAQAHNQNALGTTYEDVTDEDLHQNITDFFSVLEAFVSDELGLEQHKPLQIAALRQIDADDTLVALSAAKMTHMIKKDPTGDPKEVLCKELLKRWKPSRKIVQN
jgi:hypothetical protein